MEASKDCDVSRPDSPEGLTAGDGSGQLTGAVRKTVSKSVPSKSEGPVGPGGSGLSAAHMEMYHKQESTIQELLRARARGEFTCDFYSLCEITLPRSV